MSEEVDLTDYTDTEKPSEWTEKRVSEIFDNIYSGGTPKRGVDEYYGGEIPFVKIEDLNRQRLEGVSTAEEYITQDAIAETSVRAFEPGTLLLTIYGVLAETAIVRSRVATNQAILGLWGSADDNALYIKYAVEKDQPILESLSRQTTQANLGKGIVEKHRLSVPSIEEQRKIASVLYSIDQAIQKTEEIVQQTERLRTGLRRELVIGGIDHDEFQEMRIGPFKFEMPESWGIVSVVDACENLDKDRIPVKKAKREEMQGDIPYYGASGIIDHVDDYLFDDDLILLAEDGENLLSRNLPIAFKISGKAWVNNHAHVLKPREEFNIDFLVEYFELLNYEPFVTGSAQPKLTQSNMEMLSVPKPPVEEQAEISSVQRSISEYANICEQDKEKLQRLKQALMQDLLSGTVRTTDADIEVLPEVAQHG